MSKKKRGAPGVVEQLRQAIRNSNQSLNKLCIATGLDRGGLSRFMRGLQDISGSAIEKLCDELQLELVGRAPPEAEE